MHIERSRPRIAPKDFQDFQIFVEQEYGTIVGFLGNISEDGLCIIAPEGTALPEIQGPVEGRVVSRRLPEAIEFRGSIAWKSSSQIQGQPQQLAGVKFEESIELPDIMIALSMSASD